MNLVAEKGAAENRPSCYFGNCLIWFGLFAPPKTSTDVIERLDRLVRTIVADEAVQKRFNDLGVDASVLSQDVFANMIRSETQTHLDVIKRTGMEFGN